MTQSMNFRINRQRLQLIDNLSTEYLSIIAILYGDQIETGVKRISNYGDMTMLEAENELRVRMLMMRGLRMRKKKHLMAEHTANEQALLEELKRAQK